MDLPPQAQPPSTPDVPPAKAHLWDLAQIFLKLGCIGFGGPQAHIAMIHEEVVTRRGWITESAYLEGVALCEMLPGPVSTQTGIYIGYLRAGPGGALVAGVSFIAPAFLMVLGLSWAYFRFQGVPQVEALFLGIAPVVIAIMVGFGWKLSQRAIKDWVGGAITLVTLLLSWRLGVNVLLLFLGAGLAGWLIYRPKAPPGNGPGITPGLALLGVGFQGIATLPTEPLVAAGFWGMDRIRAAFLPLSVFFLKTGAFIFGGGLVIIPLMETAVVDDFGWMSRNQFIDGVAIGELTPGPVVITAAFVGYRVAGALGALVATVAVFLPSFGFIMLASPFLQRLRQRPAVKGILKGVLPAVLGAIAAAMIPLAQVALVQPTLPRTMVAVAIAVAALGALIRLRRPPWQLVLAGAMVGLLAGILGP